MPIFNSPKTASWKDEICSWYKEKYPIDSRNTIGELLEHIFTIINEDKTKTFSKKIINLATDLKIITDNFRKVKNKGEDKKHEVEHHLSIIELIKLGIDKSYPHLFMFNQIKSSDLLDVEDYVKLMLGLRYHSDHNDELTEKYICDIKENCLVAKYIYAQRLRKKGEIDNAEVLFREIIDGLGKFNTEHVCSCSMDDSEKKCNVGLLLAETYRGLAVIYRVLKKGEDSEKFFEKAVYECETLLKAIENKDLYDKVIKNSNKDKIIKTTFEKAPERVTADVFFSYAYYKYEMNCMEKAKDLFNKSIDYLGRINEKWDAPYFRLAIVYMYFKKYDEAIKAFAKSEEHAKDAIEKGANKESYLGKPICVIGREISNYILNNDNKIKDIVVNKEEDFEKVEYIHLKELNNVCKKEKFYLSSLKCHYNDVKKMHKIIKDIKIDDSKYEKIVYLLKQCEKILKDAIIEAENKKIEMNNSNNK